MVRLHPGDDRSASGKLQRQSLRPDQNLEALRIPLNQCRDAGTQPHPENYFAEVEQAAFSPSAVVSGISFSPDKVLQARVMSYPDAQRYRLGGNYQQLPVNQPKCPVMHNQRDGLMALGNNGGSSPNYEPNSVAGVPKQKSAYAEPPPSLSNVAGDRYDHHEGNDDYTQASDRFWLLKPDQQERLAHNAGGLSQASQAVQMRQLCHFFRADVDYGRLVAAKLGIAVVHPYCQRSWRSQWAFRQIRYLKVSGWMNTGDQYVNLNN